MTRLRQDAIELLEQMPEDKLIFMIQIMKGVRGKIKKRKILPLKVWKNYGKNFQI